MAEVLLTLGVASNVLQVIDFAAKVAYHTHQLVTGTDDALRENIEIEKLTRAYHDLSTDDDLSPTNGNCGSGAKLVVARQALECKTEARALLDSLEDLKIAVGATGVRRMYQGARQTLRARQKRDKIESRRKKLQELTNQLVLAQLLELRETLCRHGDLFSDTVKTIETASANNSDAFSELKAAMVGANLRLDLLAQRMPVHEGLKPLQMIQAQNEKTTAIEEQSVPILASLHYSDMGQRRSNIAAAYEDTFDWLLADESLGFLPWLREGKDIFWISGKAGSGKSTLMKYLAKCATTRKLLKIWTRDKPFVFVDSYFWYLGTPLQKSLEGLLRDMFYQIFKECPWAIQYCFPDQWMKCSESHAQLRPWTMDELMAGLEQISSQSSPIWTGWEHEVAPSFCFFIDGLDEYHGRHQELIHLLSKLGKNPRIKLCVSSRPWNAFCNAYGQGKPSLRLETLSERDVRKYVVGELASSGINTSSFDNSIDQEMVNQIITEVVDKAEGVFLWVYLVVRSLQDGFWEGDSIGILLQRVRAFPADLEEFFETMLSRVDPVYQHQTCQALKLAHAYANNTGATRRLETFHDFWLLRQYPNGLEDRESFFALKTRNITTRDTEAMMKETQCLLSACCKDLLWLPYAEVQNPLWGDLTPKVTFLHRTVFDFLSSDALQLWLKRHVPAHFSDESIFHLLNLARLKVTPGGYPDSYRALFDQTVETSISTDWSGLDTRFVDDLEQVALDRNRLSYGTGNRPWPSDERKTIAAFAHFGNQKYARHINADTEHNTNDAR